MRKNTFQLPTIFLIPLLALLLLAIGTRAQKADTILIDAARVNTKVLKEGVHRYLVYFKMGKDTNRTHTQFWTRVIEHSNYNSKDAIVVTQIWEDKDTIVHKVKSICDARSFQPLYHESWWKQRGSGSYDFLSKAAVFNNQILSDADTAKTRKNAWTAFKDSWDKYILNWHLDLEVFPILPYKKGVTFLVPFYDPGFSAPKNVAYTVVGSDMLLGYDDQKIECWLLRHEEKGNIEVFWISKKTREVLKLEQEVNGKLYRYKIKLGFSI
jgi:hypothetical protein